MSELQTGCREKSSFPKDFTKNILDGVDTDIFNKLRYGSYTFIEIYSYIVGGKKAWVPVRQLDILISPLG